LTEQRRGGITVQLLPRDGGTSRSLELSPLHLRLLLGGLAVTILVALLMVGSWWFLAREAAQGWRLQTLVDSLEEERTQVLALARRMEQVEEKYEHLRALFGPGGDPLAPDLWLPPSGLPGARGQVPETSPDRGIPRSWPLTEPGFVTQPLGEGEVGDHPGLDIAIPTDSYVRAAGPGRVVRTGDDPIYGLFVVLEHEEGFQTVYAHASLILVERGRTVRTNEVIALTGSTGRSTAPHLHFEVLRDGDPVDPLTMVQPPG